MSDDRDYIVFLANIALGDELIEKLYKTVHALFFPFKPELKARHVAVWVILLVALTVLSRLSF